MTPIHYSLKSLKKIIGDCNPSQVVLVSSPQILKVCSWAVSDIQNSSSQKIRVVEIADGEAAKGWGALENLLQDLLSAKVDREALLIALGGGAVTDVVGFAASILKRGVWYVNIPTTILGQVDAAIGGKTAINFHGYKNQLGTFYDPVAIVVESRFLSSLKEQQIVDGLGEIIKAGFIKDPSIITLLEKHGRPGLLDESIQKQLILKSISVKEYFVAKDPKDRGIRQVLNFGHTIGHALELEHNLPHGEAVLIGMVKELEIGEKLGETPANVRERLMELYIKVGLEVNFKLPINTKRLLQDKKIIGEHIQFPCVTVVGSTQLKTLAIDTLVKLL